LKPNKSMNKLVKMGLFSVGGLSLLVVALLITVQIASERVEVVDLLTVDENGDTVSTRLWLVDDDGFQYLRAGNTASSWYSRIQANADIAVTRNNETLRYTTLDRSDKRARINQLMNEKYTWGDDFMAMIAGSRDGGIPVELHPID
jgi:hypothetical protein